MSSLSSTTALSPSEIEQHIAHVQGALINGPVMIKSVEQAEKAARRLHGVLSILVASGVDEKEVFYAASANFRAVLKRWDPAPSWIPELIALHPSWLDDPFYDLEDLIGPTNHEASSAQPSPAVSASALSDAISDSRSKRKRDTPSVRGRQPKARGSKQQAPAASRSSSRVLRQTLAKTQTTPEPSAESMDVDDKTPKQNKEAVKIRVDEQPDVEDPEVKEEEKARMQEWDGMTYKERSEAWRTLYVTPPAGAMVYAVLKGEDMCYHCKLGKSPPSEACVFTTLDKCRKCEKQRHKCRYTAILPAEGIGRSEEEVYIPPIDGVPVCFEPVDALREYLCIQASGARQLPPLTGWEMVMQLKDWEEAWSENGPVASYEEVVCVDEDKNQEDQDDEKIQEDQENEEENEENEAEEPPVKRLRRPSSKAALQEPVLPRVYGSRGGPRVLKASASFAAPKKAVPATAHEAPTASVPAHKLSTRSASAAATGDPLNDIFASPKSQSPMNLDHGDGQFEPLPPVTPALASQALPAAPPPVAPTLASQALPAEPLPFRRVYVVETEGANPSTPLPGDTVASYLTREPYPFREERLSTLLNPPVSTSIMVLSPDLASAQSLLSIRRRIQSEIHNLQCGLKFYDSLLIQRGLATLSELDEERDAYIALQTRFESRAHKSPNSTTSANASSNEEDEPDASVLKKSTKAAARAAQSTVSQKAQDPQSRSSSVSEKETSDEDDTSKESILDGKGKSKARR